MCMLMPLVLTWRCVILADTGPPSWLQLRASGYGNGGDLSDHRRAKRHEFNGVEFVAGRHLHGQVVARFYEVVALLFEGGEGLVLGGAPGPGVVQGVGE